MVAAIRTVGLAKSFGATVASDHPSHRYSPTCNQPAPGSEPHEAALSLLPLSGLPGLPPS